MPHTLHPITRCTTGAPRRPARGGLLIEVLVSMFILSLAVLGSVAVQMNGIAQTRQAVYLAAASAAAQEMADLIRNNSSVAEEYKFGEKTLDDKTPEKPTRNCIEKGCNATQLATWERDDWLRRLQQRMPGAHVTICRDSNAFDTSGQPKWACTAAASGQTAPVWIKIAWPERRPTYSQSDADDTTSIVASFDDSGSAIRPLVVIPVVLRSDFGS